MNMHSAADHQCGDLIDDFVIRQLGNLPRMPFLQQHCAQALHLQNIRLDLAKILAEGKAILAAKILAVVSTFRLSAQLPVASPKHTDRLCGHYMSINPTGFSDWERFSASPCWR
jgi:hypothetical protein